VFDVNVIVIHLHVYGDTVTTEVIVICDIVDVNSSRPIRQCGSVIVSLCEIQSVLDQFCLSPEKESVEFEYRSLEPCQNQAVSDSSDRAGKQVPVVRLLQMKESLLGHAYGAKLGHFLEVVNRFPDLSHQDEDFRFDELAHLGWGADKT
jgi:hypothetical protein